MFLKMNQQNISLIPNAAEKASDIEIRSFLDYIKNKRPTDSFTNTIDLAVKKV